MKTVAIKARPARDRPRSGGVQKRSMVWMTDADHFGDLTCRGYTTLGQSPEVATGVNTIARLIGAMTIHLMRNTENGDVRVRNEISDVVDIEPNRYMTRSNLVQWIVRTMLLDGRGNSVVWPLTEGGRLRELIPIAPATVAFVPDPDGFGYRVVIDGAVHDPDDVLHFAANPGSYYPWLGQGFTVNLTDVATTSNRQRRPRRDSCRASGSPA